jgi:hypothetical protein
MLFDSVDREEERRRKREPKNYSQAILPSAAHVSNPIKQTAKQISQICQILISNQTNAKYRI